MSETSAAAPGAGTELIDELAGALQAVGLSCRLDGDALIVDGTRVVPFLVLRAHPTPADLSQLVREHRRRSPAVVVADRISEPGRGVLRDAGWGWLDRRGHIRLWASGARIDSSIPGVVPERSGPSSPWTQVGLEVARGLDHAHRLAVEGRAVGLVHRDVSPSNILLSREGEVKLADFGIARAEQGDLTVPGTLEGKLAWVAPEQARGEPVDGRADLFSLGVVLWELLTGARPFARETEAATLEALLRGPVPSPPSGWNEGIPPALDALVLACLEREAGRRPASAREVADRLRALLPRMAAAPQDWELRPFMRRLWPEGEVRAAPPPAPTSSSPWSGWRARATSPTRSGTPRASSS